MNLTVLIPTHRRPHFLRSSLHSVRYQSRRDVIAEVIVSENSTDQQSLRVAEEFPDLPIRHVHQQPPVPPYQHFVSLLALTHTDHVALLGDDDIWGRYHLEEAVRCLTSHADAVAYVGQDVWVADESRYVGGPSSFAINAAVDDRASRFQDCWRFGAREMATACLAATPFNMWALVGRTDVLQGAFTVFVEPNAGHDADRFMFWQIARRGPLVIGREIDLFYRRHNTNFCKELLTLAYDREQRQAAEYTRRILEEADAMGIPLREDWIAALAAVPDWRRNQFYADLIPGCRMLLGKLWEREIRSLFPSPTPLTRAKSAVRSITPPVLWKWASALKNHTLRSSP